MSNEFEQPVEPMSRTEDLLRTGTEEPVIAMSRIEKILRGEKIKPQSRIEDLLLKYNPSDILIEKSITENGTYYARIDNADGYYKVIVDTPIPHLDTRTIQNNGHFRSDVDGLDGYSNVTVNVADNTPNYEQLNVTQNGVYVPPSSTVITFGPADGIPENTETQVNTGGLVTRKDKLTVKCVNSTTSESVSASIQTESIADKAIPQSIRAKTLIICEDANHYVYLTKAEQDLFVTQKGYTFNGQSFELQDNVSAFNQVTVNVPANVNEHGFPTNGVFNSSVYGLDGFNKAVVTMQTAAVRSATLNATQNGTYTPSPLTEEPILRTTIPDETETAVTANESLSNYDILRVTFTNKTTGVAGSRDIYPGNITYRSSNISFYERTIFVGDDADHYITLASAQATIYVLQKGYNITDMKLIKKAGYFSEVDVNLPDGTNTEY